LDPSSIPPKGKPTYPDPSPGPTGRYLFRRRGGRGTRYGGFSGFGNQYRMQPFNPQPAYDTQPSIFLQWTVKSNAGNDPNAGAVSEMWRHESFGSNFEGII